MAEPTPNDENAGLRRLAALADALFEAPEPSYPVRPVDEERMVRFGYYLTIAANLLSPDDPRLVTLVEAGYENPISVCREASAWCYTTGREAARSANEADRG